ncbi:uncharacterized protein [Clytia hemisphaerica]|uniref:uncharacterized protein n=1 Tax=Clytia hemisphaerica TaxID=252671 RepID=UPI0034D5810B
MDLADSGDITTTSVGPNDGGGLSDDTPSDLPDILDPPEVAFELIGDGNIPAIDGHIPAIDDINDDINDNEVSEQSSAESSYSESDIDCLDDEDQIDNVLCEKLKTWALNNNCTRACVNEVLGIVGDLGCKVPKDKRTLLNTQRTVAQTPMGLGHYIYIGVENRITKLLSYNDRVDSIVLFVNMDGLPLFKSSPINLWPILIQFHIFKPIAVAFYCGKTKPPFTEFMNDFVVEMNHLIQNGFIFQNVHYHVSLFCLTSDSPARSGIKGIIQHTGYFSCERCCIKGDSVKGRIVFDRGQEGANVARTDDAFRMDLYAIPDEDGKRHQTNVSLLTNLPIKDIAIDPMHLIFLGVTRRLLYYLKGSFRKIKAGKLSAAYLNAISTTLNEIRLPTEFARKARTLSELDRWKATELSSFLLYSGLVVLKPYLSSPAFKHFLSFSIAIRLPSEEDATIRNRNIAAARDLLAYFVNNSHLYYGETFCVYNVHNVVHLPDDVFHYRLPLMRFSCFQFENHLQKIKRLVRGRNNPLSQIVKRCDELDGRYYLKKQIEVKYKPEGKDSWFLASGLLIQLKRTVAQGEFFLRNL